MDHCGFLGHTAPCRSIRGDQRLRSEPKRLMRKSGRLSLPSMNWGTKSSLSGKKKARANVLPKSNQPEAFARKLPGHSRLGGERCNRNSEASGASSHAREAFSLSQAGRTRKGSAPLHAAMVHIRLNGS